MTFVITESHQGVRPMSDKKKTATKKLAKKTPAIQEGMITLAALAAELKVEPRAARIKLRKAALAHDSRWGWTKGSAELTTVRKLLSAK
jgi:hypothetical protein